MLQTYISLSEKRNQDGSISFFMDWQHQPSGPRGHIKLFRSEADPSKASLRRWREDAARIRNDKRKEFEADSRAYMQPCALDRAGLEYQRHLKAVGKSESLQGRFELGAMEFIAYSRANAGPANVSGVTVLLASRWRDFLLEKGMAASSVNTRLADLSGWFDWLQGEGRLPAERHPWKIVNRCDVDRQQRPRQVFASREDFWAFFNDERWTDYQRNTLLLLAMSGLRMGEAANLRWSDYDQGAGVLSIKRQAKRETTKRHERLLPVPACLRQVLIALAIHTGASPDNFIVGIRGGSDRIQTQPNKWLAGNGTPHQGMGLHPHSLRRWYRMALESLSEQLWHVDDLLGHHTNRTRAAYTPAVNPAARLLVDQFSAWLLGA